jgi:phosphocarrier protein HPr
MIALGFLEAFVMIRKQITLRNKYGLHTRAAAKLVNLAKRFQSKIELVIQKNPADCKSIMALILLGAKKGTTFDLVVAGADEEAAAEAVFELIRGKFGEEE